MAAESVSPSESRAPLVSWVPLLRAVGIASDGKILLLAAAGLVFLHIGWRALDSLIPPTEPALSPLADLALEAPVPTGISLDDAKDWLARTAEPYRVMVGPFFEFFDSSATALTRWHGLACALWSIFIWGLFGGAMARLAVVQQARRERVGFRTAFRFASSRIVSLVLAPLAPFIAVTLLFLLIAFSGLLYRIPTAVGPILGSAFLIVPLFLGLVLSLILLGLACCWPLMHLTIVAEGEDMFDALSRSFSYFNQRRGHYVLQVVAAWVLGAIGAIAVAFFARMVVALTFWGLELGGGSGAGFRGPTPADILRGFWLIIIELLVIAWNFSYFWSAFAAIYLNLRRDVDGTPVHDIYFPSHDADTFAPEPPAKVET